MLRIAAPDLYNIYEYLVYTWKYFCVVETETANVNKHLLIHTQHVVFLLTNKNKYLVQVNIGATGAAAVALIGASTGLTVGTPTASNISTKGFTSSPTANDLSWDGSGTTVPKSAGNTIGAGFPASGSSHSAPNSGSGVVSGGGGGGGGGIGSLTPAALLGRGREADTAFTAALDAYQRRAAEDSAVGVASGFSKAGGSGVVPPSVARLAARAAFLYADVAAAGGDGRSGVELQVCLSFVFFCVSFLFCHSVTG